jgi:hypothetical protein
MLEITASSSCRDPHARSRWSSFGVKLQRRRLLVNGVSASGPAWGEAGPAGIHYTSQLPVLGNRQGKYSAKKLLLLWIGTANAKYDMNSRKFVIKMGSIPTGALKYGWGRGYQAAKASM